jgi:hypothetical protein
MSGPYTEAVKSFAHSCIGISGGSEPAFPQIIGLVPSLMIALHSWAMPYPFIEQSPFYGQDRRYPNSNYTMFGYNDNQYILSGWMKYRSVMKRGTALMRTHAAGVLWCGETLMSCDTVAESIPAQMWQWSYVRSADLDQIKHPMQGDKWKCWHIMPTYHGYREWAGGHLDKRGNPP